MRTLLPALALVLLSARAQAGQDEPLAGGGADELLVEQDWGDGPLTPWNVQSASRRRGNAGRFLLVAGGLATALGAGLMIGEFAVKPRPGEQKVWSDKGCMVSFVFGLILVPYGLHMASAGAALLARSRTLSGVAQAMEHTGPDPRWRGWHGEGQALRVVGSVLSLLGTGFITMSMVASIPSGICRKWKCQAWPEYGPWEGWSSEPVEISIMFALGGALFSTLGLSLLVVGAVKQARTLERIGPVALVPSPTGLTLLW